VILGWWILYCWWVPCTRWYWRAHPSGRPRLWVRDELHTKLCQTSHGTRQVFKIQA
jgi:hypothetical protein